MDYGKVYHFLIWRAIKEEKGREKEHKLWKKSKFSGGRYFERHHIFPKSLYPCWKDEEWNIVLLTANEHFFAHQLLSKIFRGPEMMTALHRLATDGKHRITDEELRRITYDYSNSESLRSIRRKNSTKMWQNPEIRKKILTGMEKNKEKRDSHRNEIMATKEYKQHLSEAMKAKSHSEKIKELHKNNGKNVMTKIWSDPILRAKRLEALRLGRLKKKGAI